MFAAAFTIFALPMGWYAETQDVSPQVGNLAEKIDRSLRPSRLQQAISGTHSAHGPDLTV
jgi:hypothetical protein